MNSKLVLIFLNNLTKAAFFADRVNSRYHPLAKTEVIAAWNTVQPTTARSSTNICSRSNSIVANTDTLTAKEMLARNDE